MFSTVIVPLDGSRGAEGAIAVARDEARGHGAPLVLIRLIPLPEVAAAGRHGRPGGRIAAPLLPPAEWDRAHQEANRYLLSVARRFDLDPLTGLIVAAGDPYVQLVAEIERRPGALVVVADAAAERADASPLADAARRLHLHGLVPILAVPATKATAEQPLMPTDAAALGETSLGW